MFCSGITTELGASQNLNIQQVLGYISAKIGPIVAELIYQEIVNKLAKANNPFKNEKKWKKLNSPAVELSKLVAKAAYATKLNKDWAIKINKIILVVRLINLRTQPILLPSDTSLYLFSLPNGCMRCKQ